MSTPPKKTLVDILVYVVLSLIGALWLGASSEIKSNSKDIITLREQYAAIAQKIDNIDKRTERVEEKVDRLLVGK